MTTLAEVQQEFTNQDARLAAALAAFKADLLDEIRQEFVNQDTRTRAVLEAAGLLKKDA